MFPRWPIWNRRFFQDVAHDIIQRLHRRRFVLTFDIYPYAAPIFLGGDKVTGRGYIREVFVQLVKLEHRILHHSFVNQGVISIGDFRYGQMSCFRLYFDIGSGILFLHDVIQPRGTYRRIEFINIIPHRRRALAVMRRFTSAENVSDTPMGGYRIALCEYRSAVHEAGQSALVSDLPGCEGKLLGRLQRSQSTG